MTLIQRLSDRALQADREGDAALAALLRDAGGTLAAVDAWQGEKAETDG